MTGIPLVVAAILLCWLGLRRAIAKGREKAKRVRRAGAGPPVGDAWRRLLEADDLGEIIEPLSPHVRGALRLITHKGVETPCGQTRVGGSPDLPVSLVWPYYKGQPLAFLAQIDLVEAAQGLSANPLPRHGHLWFFCDTCSWDFSAVGSAVVLHSDGSAPLDSAAVPHDLLKNARFRPCAVSMESYEDIPDIEGLGWLNKAIGGDEGKVEAYVDVREYLNVGTRSDCQELCGIPASPHKLLGYANTIQGRMQSECQPAANDWRLLLQVESDSNAGMKWGDAGRIYFWIRDEDLRAARFDRTWTVFQCY